MSAIVFEQVEFHYGQPFHEVFARLDLRLDSTWRTGLVARNGRGKTTLLRLVAGQLAPTGGRLEVAVPTRYFPHQPAKPGQPTRTVLRRAVAPFDDWTREMERCLEQGGEKALERYGELATRFEAAGGWDVDARLERELPSMGLSSEILERPFSSLSAGEQTRALVATLFLASGELPLVDEPTNHLDYEGRERLGEYLAAKPGFLLASHDRSLLDACTDHIVALERSGVTVLRGNYSTWKTERDRRQEHERRRQRNLQREVAQLRRASLDRRRGADSKEREKRGAADKGFVGRRAAKQMKRALEIERRVERRLEERSTLLRDWEKQRQLKLATGTAAQTLLTVNNLALHVRDRTLIEDLSLRLEPGDRLAVVGPNGCGKSTLLAALAGEEIPGIFRIEGTIVSPSHVELARGYQTPAWRRGSLRRHLERAGHDETSFRQVLGVLDVGGDIFEQPLETFSEGQLKKVDLCRSFLGAADLLIWDEPLNYIDALSREQIEESVLAANASLLFVEHDRRFVERVATEIIRLG